LDKDGGLFYERQRKEIIRHGTAVVAAGGSVVGFRNAYEISGRDYFLRASEKSWEFIENTS